MNSLSDLVVQRTNVLLTEVLYDKDYIVDRIYHASKQLPFQEFDDVTVGKCYSNDTDSYKSDSKEELSTSKLVICNLRCLLDRAKADKITADTKNALIIFDGLSPESIDNICSEFSDDNLPRKCFQELTSCCWSIILAHKAPNIVSLKNELEFTYPGFSSSLDVFRLEKPKKLNFSGIITEGSNVPLIYDGVPGDCNVPQVDKAKLHSDTVEVVESFSNALESGGIVIFFPSYGRMIEYHNAFQKAGMFERVGVSFSRENRGGDHFRKSLIKLVREKKSIFLCSIRYHKEELLAEFVLSQVKMVFFVGLPYPIMGGSWEARFNKTPDEATEYKRLYAYRAVEFVNEIIHRCLNELRFDKDCCFLLLDNEWSKYGARLTNALAGDNKDICDFKKLLESYKFKLATIQHDIGK